MEVENLQSYLNWFIYCKSQYKNVGFVQNNNVH